MRNNIYRKIITFTTSVFLAALLAACGNSDQTSDIAGTYESGGTTYVFAEDGTVSVTENGTTEYGYYIADSGKLVIKLDGETRRFDYTLEGSDLSLFGSGSIFGVEYSKTADASAAIDGWTEPVTLPGDEMKTTAQAETETTAQAETETTAQAETETTAQAETETTATETPEASTAETVTETEETIAEAASEETTEETAAETQPETEPETQPETEPETEPETPWVDTFVNLVKGDIYEGAIVTFGSYEQDNVASNGAEPIEWVVLKVDGNKALLISRYALDNKAFNDGGGDVTWEWSSLRYWLNDTFYNTAFDWNEQNTIQTTFVPGDWNVEYQYVDAGVGVEDKIFILSTNQAYIYLNNESRICTPTAYAVAQGAWLDEDQGGYWGWLRTPGNSSSRAACVYPWGGIDYVGAATGDMGIVIRPALCVRIW